MKNKLIILGLLALLSTSVAADDYIIRDSGQSPLFVVNQTGEKQIQNGNLFLNGNSIIDNSGALTLGGGKVNVANGGLTVNDSGGSDSLKVQSDYGQLNLVETDESDKMWRFEVTNRDFAFTEAGVATYIRANAGGPVELTNANVRISDGNLQMNGNEIQNVGALQLGWKNLTDYPAGCGSEEAVQVVSDNLDCVSLNPSGTVNTTGAEEGHVAYFVDNDSVSGSSNLYWNNSQIRLGIGTNSPTAALDVNGQTNFRSTLSMNGNDISNTGLVDGVNIESPGNAIGIDGSNQYYVPSGAIGSSELASNAVTASGGELDSSVAGTQLGYGSGALNVQDTWVNEGGDTMTADLNLDGNNLDNPGDIYFNDNNGDSITFNLGEAGGGADNLELRSSEGVDIFDMRSDGTVYMNGSLNLRNDYNINGVDLDNPGNGIIINSNQYEIDSNAIGSGELQDNSVGNAELDNSDSFNMNGLTVEGDAQVQGDLDVWGNITNTQVSNLNINGSLRPPSGYDATFDIGSGTLRWRDAYFSGTGQFDSGLTVSSGSVSLPSGVISNTELANSAITVNANSGLSGGGSVSLGGSTGLSHADTSSVSDTSNSGGTVIRDLNFDNYGHVTGQTSYNLDNRYYTESESDSNYVDESGDTMTGNLNMSRNRIYLEDSTVQDRIFKDGSGRVVIQDADTGYFRFEGSTGITVNNADLDLGGNNLANPSSITNYFDSDACPAGEVVADIGDDGTFNCVNTVEQQSDVYVNESGDVMEGNLDFAGYDIQNAGTINASLLQENGNDIGGLYLDESGDSMSGNLNMQDHHIDNIAHLELNANSIADIRTDGVDAIRIDGNQNVDIPNGNLDVSNRVRVNNEVSYEGQRVATSAVGDWSVWDQQNSQEIAVFNEGGNVEIPNGRLRAKDGGSGWAEMYHGGSRDEAYFNTDWGGFTFNTGDGTDALHVVNGGDVSVPNGGLTVNNQLTVGSTECSTGQYIDGDGTCTSVTGETSGEYVDETGDNMTGTLDMNANPIKDVGTNNIDIGDGQGNIDMNGQRILDGGLVVVDNIGVTGSKSTAETETNGNDIYVQDDVSVDGDFVGAGADVAETINNKSKMESGTVVKLTGNMSVDKSDERYDTAVAGVVSRDPAMVMAKNRDGVPIAMSGTVPVKFSDENGAVKTGDFLTTASKKGYAMACKDLDRCEGSIIGKAMQSQSETGEVQMLVSRG